MSSDFPTQPLSERKSSACPSDQDGSEPPVTDNDVYCSVFFHEDFFSRNNSRSTSRKRFGNAGFLEGHFFWGCRT